jgi:hypothetical protein
VSTYRVVDEDGDWYEIDGDPAVALAALSARVAELESEREADTRAVGTLLRFGYIPSEGNWMTDADAAYALRARFGDRIAELDDRNGKAAS